MKKVYLAGPMRGYDEFNFPAFKRAASLLRQVGYDVVSPAELDEEEGWSPSEDLPRPLREYMQRDLPALLACDLVVYLPGSEESSGASLEVAVAYSCEIPVLGLAEALLVTE